MKLLFIEDQPETISSIIDSLKEHECQITDFVEAKDAINALIKST